MSVKEEVLDILQKLSDKLLGLPQAGALDQGAFFVLVLFIVMLLCMIGLSCSHCCISGKPKHQASEVEPLQPE